MERGNRHYSDKGGHKSRGDFSKTEERVRKENGNPTLSLKAMLVVPIPQEVDWHRRRFMQRTPQDGKR